MTPDTPVNTVDECFDYLKRNAWQFQMLETHSIVKINAQMLRSLYFHVGCAKFGLSPEKFDNIELLGAELKRLCSEVPS